MKLYFPNNTSSLIRDGILQGSVVLEKYAGVIEKAEIDNTQSTKETYYPNTPVGLNLTIRVPPRKRTSMSFSDLSDIENISNDCRVPMPSLMHYPRSVDEFVDQEVIVHVGERGLADPDWEGIHMPWVYALSISTGTSR